MMTDTVNGLCWAAQFAGQMALRLIHDHILNLDMTQYSSDLTKAVFRAYKRISQLSMVSLQTFFSLSFCPFLQTDKKDQNIFLAFRKLG